MEFEWPDDIQGAVSLSFDDSNGAQLDVGMRVLDKHEVKGTFYILPDYYRKRLAEWRDVLAAGHELGNHTVSHPCSCNFGFSTDNTLENYTIEEIAADIDAATKHIEDDFDITPRTFAYPCGQQFVGRGATSASYVPVIAERFVVGRGFRNESSNLPAVCDLARTCGTDFDDTPFDRIEPILKDVAESGRWAVFCGHAVGEGGAFTVEASMLDELCAYASDAANGLWIDTVDAIGSYVRDQQASPKRAI